ncbi:putative sulfate exporter family transporter [Colwellia sp. UCD-KL20]|uniref:YeiH family protein n=1 Tax=Colwellia sp. UCD-KL20 TaxID=1917165 RepID=UPI00097075D0|nr:putative sulfate exporter family transporter [Colwellia sp. UCD-KL20]
MDVKALLPGISITTITGLAALFLSEHYGAPAMLFALLLGIAMSFLYEDSPCRKGIEFAATFILRVGVALLGLRIALNDLISLGWETVFILILAIASTICLGVILSKQFKLSKSFGALTGGSVAICGASAAMAITAILPEHKDKERDTLVTIIAVTSLSTIAMVVYPIIVTYLGLNDIDSGFFLGGTIHDVAQVVGAGYSISEETGDMSTLVKLVRVSFLMPVVLVMLFIIKLNKNTKSNNAKATKIPVFLIAFIILMFINSFITLPEIILEPATSFSRFALVVSIAAIGMKSNFSKLKCVGFKPIVLMLVETIWIAAFILAAIWII